MNSLKIIADELFKNRENCSLFIFITTFGETSGGSSASLDFKFSDYEVLEAE